MYFKRIDMHGFKSFADPVSIEFHEGITCIVGPNGSGKSNISDAIRWVLGEQSPKMLRGGKMEEVIFAGTASRKSRGMAEVTLVIDNSTGMLPIDYAEVAITRRMYRSGESSYAINNSACRLKDIRELIMDTGIGVDGYSIIGQGKIAEIVSNKAESRREIFEEAAGIVKYRSKKMEAERKLESSQGNLERVNDIVGEIESRIGDLKADSEKASHYLVLREQYKNIEINITLQNIETMELKNEYLKDDLMELNRDLDELKEQKKIMDTDLADNRVRNQQLEDWMSAAREEWMTKTEEINELRNQSQLNQEKVGMFHRDKERLEEEMQSICQKYEKEKKGLTDLLDGQGTLETRLEELKASVTEKGGLYETLYQQSLTCDGVIEQSKNEIYELHSLIGGKRAEANSLGSLSETLENRGLRLKKEKQQSMDAGDLLQKKWDESRLEKEELERQLLALDHERQGAKAEEEEAAAGEKMLHGEMEELRISISQASTRKKMMEEMEQSYEGYNHAVKFVMGDRTLKGIHGVVAELIQVPQGLETAMETALGAAMQNIVCEDDASAQVAVASLKRNKAGRLTFLPVKSMRAGKHMELGSLRKEPGVKGLGVDCITFDERYRHVMEYLLGRVLVVDRLDTAVRLSKRGSGGFRFVTLDGEVINSGGAITGGTYRNHTSNLLERKAEIKGLGQSLTEMETRRREGESQLTVLRKRMACALEQWQQSDLAHRETERDVFRMDSIIQNLSAQLAELQSNRNKWEQELENIVTETASAHLMITRLTEACAQGEARMKEVEEAIAEKVAEHGTLKSQLEEAGESTTKARMELAALENQWTHGKKMMERTQAYLSELQRDKALKQEQWNCLKQQQTQLQESGVALTAVILEKETQKAILDEKLNQMKEEKNLTVGYVAEVEQKKDRLDGLVLAGQNNKHELELKLAKNETQVHSYKNKLWDDFEVSYIQAMEFRGKEFILGAAVKESRELKGKLKALGEVNVGAIKEYETVHERYEFLTGQRADLLGAMDALKQIIADMDKTIRLHFKESFDRIVMNFEHAFQELFGGGTAELRLEDESRPLECGIEIVAQPPGKKLQNINLMSGGEKTMTAIALMFAVLRAKPTPFCILDEVEAALDEANIDRFAGYLKNFKEIQFALVTHQKATMEFADVLYGVTMPEQGVSKVISLRLDDQFELD